MRGCVAVAVRVHETSMQVGVVIRFKRRTTKKAQNGCRGPTPCTLPTQEHRTSEKLTWPPPSVETAFILGEADSELNKHLLTALLFQLLHSEVDCKADKQETAYCEADDVEMKKEEHTYEESL